MLDPIARKEQMEQSRALAGPEASAPSLEPLDAVLRLSIIGGDREFARDLAEIFDRTTLEILTELRRAAQEGNSPRIAALAHQLKGSAGAIGARRLQQAAAALEADIRHNVASKIDQTLSALDELHVEASTALAADLRDMGS